MDIFKLAVFLSSGIGKFLICVIILSCVLPKCLLEPFGVIAGVVFIILVVVGIVDIFKNLDI